MMTNGIEIRRVGNGWRCVWYLEGEPPEEAVFESLDSEVEGFARVLRWIDECLGPTTGRYDKERIYVVVHPGDKHESFSNQIWPD